MTTIHQMAERWRSVSLTRETGTIITDNVSKIADIQRDQLMKGLDSDGKPLAPKHSQNPYFKKEGAAKRYADWKAKKFPETPYDTPNLIITGLYHSEIKIEVQGNKIRYFNTAPFAGSVTSTFKDKQLGLNNESKQKAWRIVRAPLVRKIGDITGCKVR